jgi:NADH dehydrogenase
MGHILVLGGTGFVGRSVCEQLVRKHGGGGPRIVVPTRQLHRGAHRLSMLPTVDVTQADVHDEATLQRLVAGADAVIHLVAILHGNEAAFQRVHVDLPRKLGRACAAAGVPHVVHVSALGAAPSAPSMYQRSKAAGEAALRETVPHAVVLRPSVIFGAEDRFINLFAQMQRVLPVVPLAAADAQFQPVWVCDVARAIAQALDRRPAEGALTVEVVGPQVLTLRELVQSAGRWAGHPRPVIGLPDALGRLQALAMELLPGEPLMSRDNLDSAQVPNVASGSLPTLQALGITPTAIDAVMPALLSGRDGPARLDPWRARARRF